MNTKNIYLPHTATDPEYGSFIQPDKALENAANPHELTKITIFSGYKADFESYHSRNPLFDSVTNRISQQRASISFEDQCSGKYYFDLFNVVRESLTHVNRITEVGVYTGGSACIIAGAIEETDTEFDLVDANKVFLRFTYERIRRLFPKVAARTRLYFGDLPSYVRDVMLTEQERRYLLHHDASHMFNVVVRDLASLSYVKDKMHGLVIQDTHLRGGNINSYIFVDAALYAVFGDGLHYAELGMKHGGTTEPAFQYSEHGTYFNANQPEGMFIPFSLTKFRYPHPSVQFERLFDEGVPA